MKSDKLKEIFKKAASIASVVPKNMQPAAFNRALDILYGKTPETKPQVESKRKKRPKTRKPSADTADKTIETLMKKINSTKYPQMKKLKGVKERSLLVLKIAKDSFKIDGLTPPQVAKILTEKFRISTTRQAVGMVLKDSGDLVDRVPEGSAYRYRIMHPGEEHLAKSSNKKKK